MKSTNLPSGAGRQVNAGLVWEEKLTGAQGTLLLAIQQTFRVRATGATTVTIDGVLAMTMSTGEIAIFNAGDGVSNNKNQVAVIIGGAAAFVQVAKEVETGRRVR